MKTLTTKMQSLIIPTVILLVLIFSLKGSAQYYSVEGIVHHKDKSPFEGVAIKVTDTSNIIFTHSNGSFRIDSIPVSYNKIQFQFLNFELVCQNDFKAGKLYNLDVMFHLKKRKKSYCKLESERNME